MTTWTTLAVIAQLLAAALGSDVTSRDKAAPAVTALADWSTGASSWQQASLADDERDLWAKPNACDTRVLHGSAPLTLLFGVSKFWSEIQERRTATRKTGQPLEVHVLGSAYPFEGRSDWSLLANRRPKDVPKVRIVLILGTPWHTDNVPTMDAKEFDESMSMMETSLNRVIRGKKPEAGKWVHDALECSSKSSQTREDKSFQKADLCRDHGNGLEVVCVEKYYQDVSDELSSPDAVAMFSPGFPQIARRSWDEVLRKLLLADVPIMVGDLLYSDSLERTFQQGKKNVVAPGGRWKVKGRSMEDGMTLMAMHAYGAKRLGSFRNPFPIFLKRSDDDVTAKNGVLQVFQGRRSHAKPFVMPSKDEVQRGKKELESFDLRRYFDDDDNAKEVKRSLLISTSTAYERAMSQLYLPTIRHLVAHHHKQSGTGKGSRSFSDATMAKLKELGLLSSDQKTKSKGKRKQSGNLKPWGLKDWIFIIKHLNGVDEIF
mmetsp:Transcript_45823/g.85671  ORF Transcript_45823/g.85671 Transcript_45823/m.85671 type:complete len:488 (-) Transcript_45823:181-1644(-)